VEILQLPALRSFLSGEYPATELSQFNSAKVNVSDSYGLVCEAPSVTRGRVSFFVYAAGPCQCSLSWVRVPWDPRPYFTVSDLRLPFSPPPTTRRLTVEVFDGASGRTQKKTPFRTIILYWRRVFTDSLPRNWLHHRFIAGCVYVADVT
jgi:hypothetical protein